MPNNSSTPFFMFKRSYFAISPVAITSNPPVFKPRPSSFNNSSISCRMAYAQTIRNNSPSPFSTSSVPNKSCVI